MKTLFLYILSFVIHTIHTNVIIPYRLNFRGDAIEVNPIFGNSTKSQNIEIKLDKDYTHFFRLAYPAALPDGPILTVFHSGYCTNISTVEDTITLNNETQKMKLIDFMENFTNCNINLQPQDFFKVFVCIIMLYVQLYKNSAY